MRKAILVSILVHAAVLVGARPIAAHLADVSAPRFSAIEVDNWAGTSIEISTSQEAGSGGPPAGAPPSPSTNSAGASAALPAPPPAPEPPSSASAAPSATSEEPAPKANEPKAKPTKPKATAKPKKTARPKTQKPPSRPAATAASPASASASAAPSASAASSASASASASPSASVASAAGNGESGSGKGGTFGSEGRASVRDLGRAFTRAIPAACSADRVWASLPVGDAGSLRIVLHIDAEGHIASAEPAGDSPPKHLLNVLRRTIPLLSAGTFAVQGTSPVAGTQTIELSAVVSDEPAGDDPAGARDRLAFSYDSGRGKASFTQTGGRRVELSVRVVSVTVD